MLFTSNQVCAFVRAHAMTYAKVKKLSGISSFLATCVFETELGSVLVTATVFAKLSLAIMKFGDINN